jgi:hypothetical protein
MSHVSPNEPDENTVPIVLESCVLPPAKNSSYSAWHCQLIRNDEFDKIVQIKLAGKRLLVYCPYQRYQLNYGFVLPCPADEVLSLPATANVTIMRHAVRGGNVIMGYAYGSVDETGTSKFGIPEKLELVFPPDSELIEKVNRAIKAHNHTHDEVRNLRSKMRYKFIEATRRVAGHLSTKWVIGIGVTVAGVVTLIFILCCCVRRKSVGNAIPPSAPTQQPNYDYREKQPIALEPEPYSRRQIY